MRKLITIILVLATSVAFSQTTYQLNYDSIRVGKTAGNGATSLYGKTYLKNATEGTPSDSVLTVRNGRVYKIAGSAISSVGFLTYVFSRDASDIAGYEQMPALTSYTIGAADTATVAATTTPAIIQEFATNTGFPNTTLIPAGVFNVSYQVQKNSGSQSFYTYAVIYKRNLAGTETTIATTNNSSSVSANTVQSVSVSAVSPTDISLLTTDRIVVKVFAVMVSGTANISIYYDDATDSRLAFPSALVDATNFVPYNGAVKDLVSAFSITGDSIKRVGGTGAQFLMGNGTVQDTTQIQTVANFFPKGDTRYAKGIGNAVLTTGNQSIAGTKTFTESVNLSSSSGNTIVGATSNTTASPTFFVKPKLGTHSTLGGINFYSTTSSNDPDNNGFISGGYLNSSGNVVATKSESSAIQMVQGDIVAYTNSGLTPTSSYTANERLKIAANGDVKLTSMSGSGNRILLANGSNVIKPAIIGSGLAFDGTTLTATGGSSGSITGSGTSGVLPIFSGSSSISDSNISYDGSSVRLSYPNVGGEVFRYAYSPQPTNYYLGINALNPAAGNITYNFHNRNNGVSYNNRLVFDQGYVVMGNATAFSTDLLQVNGNITASVFNGAGTGLTGTASSLTAGAISGQANSATITASQSATNSTIAQRDGVGQLFATYFIQTSPNNEAGTISQIMYTNGTDGYFRKAGVSQMQSFLGLGSNAYTSTAYAPLNSPAFTGTVSGITASMVGAPSGSGTSTGTNTGDQNLAPYALLNSPAFTGTPTAPTQTQGDNSTKIATTAYVDGLGGTILGAQKQIATTYTNISTSGTSEQSLFNHNIAQSNLSSDGDRIDFNFVGSFGLNANDKYVRISVGGNLIPISGNASNKSVWEFEGYLMRTSSATYRIFIKSGVDYVYTSTVLDRTVTDFNPLNFQILGQTNNASFPVTVQMGYLQGRKAP